MLLEALRGGVEVLHRLGGVAASTEPPRLYYRRGFFRSGKPLDSHALYHTSGDYHS